jgi:hypothetical protein
MKKYSGGDLFPPGDHSKKKNIYIPCIEKRDINWEVVEASSNMPLPSSLDI